MKVGILENIFFYKYKITGFKIVQEEYKDKKKKGQFKDVKTRTNVINFDKLISDIIKKHNFDNLKNGDNRKPKRIFKLDKCEEILENDNHKIIIFQFKGGIDSDRSNVLNVVSDKEKANSRKKDEVEKRIQTLIFIYDKKSKDTILFSESREGLLYYKHYIECATSKDEGYESLICSTGNFDQIIKTYKAVEVIVQETVEDQDGRYTDDETITNFAKVLSGENINIRKYLNRFKAEPNKKNKIVFVNDSGKRLTVNGCSFHERLTFPCEYDIKNAGFNFEQI